jgi:hypothetical protein
MEGKGTSQWLFILENRHFKNRETIVSHETSNNEKGIYLLFFSFLFFEALFYHYNRKDVELREKLLAVIPNWY